MSDKDENRSEGDVDRATEGERRRAERVEGIIGAVAALLVLVLLGFIGWEAVSDGGGGPELSVELGEPMRQGETLVLPVTVRNAGTVTAADVVVTGTIGEAVGQVTLRYVPERSAVEAALVFPRDAGEGEAAARIAGFALP